MEIVLLLAVFIVFIFFSNQRRKKAATQLENSVKVGAKAVMLGGITGVIAEIRDTSVIVETFPGTKIEFLKAAVRSVDAPSLDAVPVNKVGKAKQNSVGNAPSTPVKKSSTTKAVSTKAKSSTSKSAK